MVLFHRLVLSSFGIYYSKMVFQREEVLFERFLRSLSESYMIIR